MGPKRPAVASDHDLFRFKLVDLIDSRHELVRLAGLIDRTVVEREVGGRFALARGHLALSSRLVARLLICQTRRLPAMSKRLLTCRRVAGVEPAQGRDGRGDPCGARLRWAQPEDGPGAPASAFFVLVGRLKN